VPIAPRLVAELNAHLPGAVRRADVPLAHGSREARLATGFAALDAVLDGGLPRGRLSELVGPTSTGLTSLVHRLLGHVTGQGQLAAWIDAPDAFDPTSAVAAGVDLDRLLWVRPPDLAAAFSAAEALLGMGGFPLVLLDASAPRYRPHGAGDEPPRVAAPGTWRDGRRSRQARGMGDASHVWMRLARAAAGSRSALVVLQRTRRAYRPSARSDGARTVQRTSSGSAGFSAAVRLEVEPLRVVWSRADGAPSLLDGLVARILVTRNRGGRDNPGPVVLEIA
jgi:RecA/RadA recombinase